MSESIGRAAPADDKSALLQLAPPANKPPSPSPDADSSGRACPGSPPPLMMPCKDSRSQEGLQTGTTFSSGSKIPHGQASVFIIPASGANYYPHPSCPAVVTLVPYPTPPPTAVNPMQHCQSYPIGHFPHTVSLPMPAQPPQFAVAHGRWSSNTGATACYQTPTFTTTLQPVKTATGGQSTPSSRTSSSTSTSSTQGWKHQRRRSVGSSVSGRQTASTSTEGEGSIALERATPLLSPPNIESDVNVYVRTAHTAPYSPVTSEEDEEEDVVVDVVDDSDNDVDEPDYDIIEPGSNDEPHITCKRYICNVCCKAFMSMDELKQHHGEQHIQQRLFKCDLCEKSFQHQYSLRVHRRSRHNDINACSMFPCEHCQREFASAASLRVHARMHTGERPFRCQRCQKTFMRQHQLKMHQRVHSGEKPHQCDVCNKTFTQFKYLKEHCQRHAGYLPHKCELCKKAFLRPSHLKKHMRVHNVECNYYACPVCDVAFEGTNSLQQMQQHLAAKSCKRAD